MHLSNTWPTTLRYLGIAQIGFRMTTLHGNAATALMCGKAESRLPSHVTSLQAPRVLRAVARTVMMRGLGQRNPSSLFLIISSKLLFISLTIIFGLQKWQTCQIGVEFSIFFTLMPQN